MSPPLSPAETTQRLDALYAELPDPVDLPGEEHATIERRIGRHAAAYGEPTGPDLARVLSWLKLGPDDTFVDIGSGTGRILLQAALQSAAERLVGVEIAPSRHAIAVDARSRLATDRQIAPQLSEERITLVEGDVTSWDWPAETTVVWAGITAFPAALRADVARTAASLPYLRAFVSTHPLEPEVRGLFTPVGEIAIATSWTHRLPLQVLEPRRR